MPVVRGKKYAYDKKGKAAAKRARKKGKAAAKRVRKRKKRKKK